MGYEARKFGITRMLRGDEARKKCPSIQLAYVPEKRGKADLTSYRQAGAEVISILSQYTSCIERASIDEAFLDITEKVLERIRTLEFSVVQPSSLPATHVAGKACQSCDPSPRSCDTMENIEIENEEYTDRLAQSVTNQTTDSTIGPLHFANDPSDLTNDPLPSNVPTNGSSLIVNGSASSVPVDCCSIPACHSAGSPSNADPILGPDTLSSVSDIDDVLPLTDALEDEEDAAVFANSDVTQQERENRRLADLTQWLTGEGNAEELLLAVGALIAKEMREAVFMGTGFTCSAGISYNKVLLLATPITISSGNHANVVVIQAMAKLAAGMNKPNQQTILPWSRVSSVFSTTPVRKL